MEAGLYANNFSQVFSRLLEKIGATCYQISAYSHIDQAYLSRLKSGEKGNPSPEILMRISIAFAHLNPRFTIPDAERLFNSVGRSLRVNA